MDGNTAAWQRVPWILQSGSVLLLVETPIEEWFYNDLKPWEHYVPIKADFSDLEEKVQWLRKNDDEAKNIVRRASVFARYHFSKEQIRRYLVQSMQTYSKYYNKK